MIRKHRGFIVIMGMIVIILFILFSVVIYIENQNHTYQQNILHARRQHIFCELLKPGMDKQSVLNILEKFGTFYFGKSELPSEERNFSLHGGYDNPQIVGDDYFYLIFRDGKYVNVSIQDGSRLQPICHP
jgi:hypothetical protein